MFAALLKVPLLLSNVFFFYYLSKFTWQANFYCFFKADVCTAKCLHYISLHILLRSLHLKDLRTVKLGQVFDYIFCHITTDR